MPRPRKPLEQKVLDGSYRPCKDGPLPENLADWRSGDGPAPGPPEKPSDLGDEASKMWDFVLKSSPGRVWPSDGPALAIYCDWWEIYKLCLAKAKSSKATPKLTSLGIATDKLLLLGAKFGLTPKDRSAIPVETVGPVKAKVETRQKTKLDLDLERELAKKPKK